MTTSIYRDIQNPTKEQLLQIVAGNWFIYVQKWDLVRDVNLFPNTRVRGYLGGAEPLPKFFRRHSRKSELERLFLRVDTIANKANNWE